MNNTDFVARVKDALKEKGISIAQFLNDMNLTNNTLTMWAKGNSPRAETVFNAARYLNTTVEYLLTGESTDANYTETVRRIASKVARLPAEYQRFIEKQADLYIDALETSGDAMPDVPPEVRECAYEIVALPPQLRAYVFNALDFARAQSSAQGAEGGLSAV